jgi:hypothetical protein
MYHGDPKGLGMDSDLICYLFSGKKKKKKAKKERKKERKKEKKEVDRR